MGIFSRKATDTTADVKLAYDSRQSTGLVLVRRKEKKHETSMSHYDIHKPAILDIFQSFQEYEDESVLVPVVVRLDLKSPYQPSLGVYFENVQVGWVLKDEITEFVQIIRADGRKGVGILGELHLVQSDENDERIFHELYIFA